LALKIFLLLGLRGNGIPSIKSSATSILAAENGPNMRMKVIENQWIELGRYLSQRDNIQASSG
jgi:hypothetical protein